MGGGRAWAWGWPWMSLPAYAATSSWASARRVRGTWVTRWCHKYWGCLDECGEGRRRQCIRYEASEREAASDAMEVNELFPSLERSLVRSLAGLMMTICLMLPLSRTGSVCLTSSGSAGRRVKGCPWAARGKGMGLGSAGEECAWAGLRRFCVCVYLSWEVEGEE